MLIEFKVANFRSIREAQTFSLVAGNADKELPGCVIDRELPGLSGVRFLKGAAIYGANASGKSNVLGAMRFVADLALHSATRLQPGAPTGIQPFKLDRESGGKPSEFELTFVAEGVRFVFGFAVTSERVVEEYLVAYPKGVPQRWYERRYDAAKDAYEWSRPSTAFQQDRSLQSKTRPNSLFLSVGAQFNHAQLTRVYEWFAKGLRFIHFGLEDVFNLDLTKELIAQAKQRDRILGLVCHADLGVADAQIREREAVLGDFLDLYLGTFGMGPDVQRQAKPSTRLEVSLTHQADGVDPVALDFEKEESAGTRRFFSLVGPWMEVLDRGHTVFVDEIETSLHPNLVKELLRLFLGNEGNPKGAQVVFTTHNPLLLDGTLMRRDQVWFTEKSSAGATHLYPLTDYQPRKDEALAKGYLAGRYGAIPFMPEGLKL